MESLLNDFRYGARRLWKSKGLTLVAVLSLAAGIGANAAIFSLVNSILFRPRAVSRPEQLVELYTRDVNQPYHSTSYPSYLDFRERNEVFSGLAAYGINQFRLGGAGEVEQVWGEVVSGNYFDVLGVQAHRGRTFLPEEDQVIGRNPVAVIGYGLWQRRFNSNPGVIGQTVMINNQPLTVVGIAPPQYTGMMGGLAIELWVPAMVVPLLEPGQGQRMITSRGNKWVTIIGRLKPGATLEHARARFAVLAREMQAAHPDEWIKEGGKLLSISMLPESKTRVHPGMRPVAYAIAALLFVTVDLVLLIACMNLASMLFARAVARRGEIAVRLALGAGRFRIIRQLLAESVLLALIAGVAGVVLAVWALDLVMGFMPPLPEGIRVALNLEVDWLVVAYTLVFATVTGILFGLAPALHSSKASVSTVLKDDSAASTGRFRKSRLRMSLVIGQVAFSLLLLIGAGLVLRSLEKVRPTRLGFSSENVVVAHVALDETAYDRLKGQQFYERLSERVAALPGVQAVSLVNGVPGGFMNRTRRSTEIEGYAARPGEDLEIDVNIVGPGYFTNMKVPVVHGRDFSVRDREGAPCVAIVNEAFAHRYLAGPSAALGKRIAGWSSGRTPAKQMCEIVGVVRDNEWQSLQKEVRPTFALPLLQDNPGRMTLMASAAGDPKSLISPVRQAIRELDPRMPVADVQTLREYFSVGLYPFRMLGFVIGFCGILSLLLATIGIYGTISYSVAQRKREVGIRMALGALQKDILRMVVGQGMVLVGYGLAAGLLLGLLLTRVLMSLPLDTELLFGVSATDSLTFVGVTLLLGTVALVACYLPALRATKVDPMVTLRSP
jgi:predicted permease